MFFGCGTKQCVCDVMKPTSLLQNVSVKLENCSCITLCSFSLSNVLTKQCCVNKVLKLCVISYKLTTVLSIYNLAGNWEMTASFKTFERHLWKAQFASWAFVLGHDKTLLCSKIIGQVYNLKKCCVQALSVIVQPWLTFRTFSWGSACSQRYTRQ